MGSKPSQARGRHRHVRFMVAGALIAAAFAAAPAYAQELAPEHQQTTIVAPAEPILVGAYVDDWSGDALRVVNEKGQPVSIGGLFHTIDENNTFSRVPEQSDRTGWLLERSWQQGATPFSNLQADVSASEIASGRHDAAINVWLDHVDAWLDRGEGRRLTIAPLQEMNGVWTPYGCYERDNQIIVEADDYVSAFRRVHDLTFARLDPDLVQISWAPNNESTAGCGVLADYYPGSEYVDVVGISAFNFGEAPDGSSWRLPAELIGPAADQLRLIAPDKPYLLAQTGSSEVGGDKSAWIVDLFDFVVSDPNLVGLIWFDLDKFEVGADMDWEIEPHHRDAWRQSPDVDYVFPMAFDDIGFAPAIYDGAVTLAGRLASIVLDSEPNCGAEWSFVDEPVGFEIASRTALRSGGYAIPPLPVDQVGLIDLETGRWLVPRRTGEVVEFYFGGQGDIPLVGDWDCDGFDTPGLFRPSDASVHLTNDLVVGPATHNFFVGLPGDSALAGDFDNDGCDTVAIYRPSTGEVFVINELGEGVQPVRVATSYHFGEPGDVPFVGDFNGDGMETVGLYRPSSGYVYVRHEHLTGLADNEFYFGDPGDRLVAGNWGDGLADTVAVYRPTDRAFYMRFTNDQGPADQVLYFGEERW
ncbi:MAG: hypothetical protein KJO36_07675, partial [Acidimicrobiia bacterium]|nr:hypothetical protein [Acidimicrobiia bacterium]